MPFRQLFEFFKRVLHGDFRRMIFWQGTAALVTCLGFLKLIRGLCNRLDNRIYLVGLSGHNFANAALGLEHRVEEPQLRPI